MNKLSATEEQLMGYIWDMKKAFRKTLLEAYPEPKLLPTPLPPLLKE